MEALEKYLLEGPQEPFTAKILPFSTSEGASWKAKGNSKSLGQGRIPSWSPEPQQVNHTDPPSASLSLGEADLGSPMGSFLKPSGVNE